MALIIPQNPEKSRFGQPYRERPVAIPPEEANSIWKYFLPYSMMYREAGLYFSFREKNREGDAGTSKRLCPGLTGRRDRLCAGRGNGE